MCCPCILPQVEANITLQNDQGVTKIDFVDGLARYLYGNADTLPMIYSQEHEDKEPKTNPTLLARRFGRLLCIRRGG
jgi:hypothetical protein